MNNEIEDLKISKNLASKEHKIATQIINTKARINFFTPKINPAKQFHAVPRLQNTPQSQMQF